MNGRRRALAMLLWLVSFGISTAGEPFAPERVRLSDRVYALVGPTDGRSYDNWALNNTLGFVVTDAGVVLIGSGATARGARLLEAAVDAVTDQPIRWVINIGTQDHHWLGNGRFAERGAQIIALRRTVEGQQRFAGTQLADLHAVLGERAEGTRPTTAPEPVAGDRIGLRLGGVRFELRHLGGGHFPGDAVVWLPDESVLFAGDHLYFERMLGILPDTDIHAWRASVAQILALAPRHLVPGHGHPGDAARARRDTADYLDWLLREVRAAQAEWRDLGETVERLSDAPFRHLKHYESWHRTNVNRAFLQLEREP